MREEADIMDEIHALDEYSSLPSPPAACAANIQLYRELQSFDPKAHWFCPRRHDDDFADYDNPDEAEDDVTPKMKRKAIEDGKHRHDVAYKYSLILGMRVEVAGRLLNAYVDRLDSLLTTCDKCVYNWHFGRTAYLKELSELVTPWHCSSFY
jgi:senataxin